MMHLFWSQFLKSLALFKLLSSTYPCSLPTSTLPDFLMIMKLGLHIQYSRTPMPVQMLDLVCGPWSSEAHGIKMPAGKSTQKFFLRSLSGRISPLLSSNIVWKPRFSPSLTEADSRWEYMWVSVCAHTHACKLYMHVKSMHTFVRQWMPMYTLVHLLRQAEEGEVRIWEGRSHSKKTTLWF